MFADATSSTSSTSTTSTDKPRGEPMPSISTSIYIHRYEACLRKVKPTTKRHYTIEHVAMSGVRRRTNFYGTLDDMADVLRRTLATFEKDVIRQRADVLRRHRTKPRTRKE